MEFSFESEPVSFWVDGVPATFATAGEWPWRAAVATAATVAMSGREQLTQRLGVQIDFVVPQRVPGHPGWDLDNLIKPTIDALTPVIGARPGKWKHQQPDDERIDEIVARKRTAGRDGKVGASITVRGRSAGQAG